MELLEGKTYGASDIEAPGRAELIAAHHALGGAEVNRRIATQAARDYGTLKGAVDLGLQELLDQYDAGSITAGQLSSRIKSTLRAAYREAFDLGMRSEGWLGGVEPADDKWLKSAYQEEWRYLNRFMSSLSQNRTVMDPKDRLTMYADTVDAIFWAGKVEASPAGGLIHWHLSVAEHCGDCIDFARGSPYTRETLPTTPRAGDSQCLSNCKCYLEIEPGAQAPPAAPAPPPEAQTELVVPAGLRLPTADEQAIVDAMAVRAAYLRQAASSTEGPMAERLTSERDAAATGLLSYLKTNSLFLKNKWPIDSAVMGQPVTDEQRNQILGVTLSLGAIALLTKKKKPEVDSLTEQFLGCVDSKTL